MIFRHTRAQVMKDTPPSYFYVCLVKINTILYKYDVYGSTFMWPGMRPATGWMAYFTVTPEAFK